MTDNIPEDADPWQYARRPKGFTGGKREFIEYLRAKALEEGDHDLLESIDEAMLEIWDEWDNNNEDQPVP